MSTLFTHDDGVDARTERECDSVLLTREQQSTDCARTEHECDSAAAAITQNE